MISEPKRSTLIIADDHPLLLEGLSNLVRREPEFDILTTCSDGIEARAAIQIHSPAIAVVDQNMPGETGLQILAWVRKEAIDIRFVLLTAALTDAEAATAVSLGADAVLTKTAAPDMLIACLMAVSEGRTWLPGEILDASRRENSRREKGRLLLADLTAREREIVGMASEDLSNKEIARLLNISDGTVKIHLNKAFSKLGVNGRIALIKIIRSIGVL